MPGMRVHPLPLHFSLTFCHRRHLLTTKSMKADVSYTSWPEKSREPINHCHEVQVSYGFKYFVAMVSLSDVAFLFVCAGSGTDLFKLGLHCGVLVCEFLDGQGFRLVVGQAEVVLRAEKGVLGFLEGCY